MSAKLGFASAFYNQLENNNHFLDISSTAFPTRRTLSSWRELARLLRRSARSRFPSDADLYQRRSHDRAGVNVNFSQWDNPLGNNGNGFQLLVEFHQRIRRGTANNTDAPGYTSGVSIASLLLGYPNSGTMNWDTFQFWSQHYFAPWVQDDWKITRKLDSEPRRALDLTTPETERHNKMFGAFDATVLNPVSSSIPTGTAALGTSPNLQGGLTLLVSTARAGAHTR